MTGVNHLTSQFSHLENRDKNSAQHSVLLEGLVKKIQGKGLALHLVHSKCSVNTSNWHSRWMFCDLRLELAPGDCPACHPIETVSRESTGREREERGGGGRRGSL